MCWRAKADGHFISNFTIDHSTTLRPTMTRFISQSHDGASRDSYALAGRNPTQHIGLERLFSTISS